MQLTTLTPIRLIALLTATAALTACGSERSTTSSTTLSLNYQPTKALNFEWTPVVGTDHYRLWENIDGQSGFRLVANNLPADTLSYNLDVPLYDRINARYMLDSCLNAVCSLSHKVQSNEVAVEVEQLVNSIGFFKAFNEDDATVNNNSASLGASVALSEDGQTLVAGAPGANITGDRNDDIGVVYTYERTAAGEWRTGQRLTAPNAEADDRFGSVVSLSADGLTLAVSATGEDNANVNATDVLNLSKNEIPQDSGVVRNPGAVYLYTRASRNDDFIATAYIKAANAGKDDEFGSALSLSADGSRLAVGAPSEQSSTTEVVALPDSEFGADNSAGNTGAVYLYRRDDTNNWQEQAYIKASNAEQDDQFGSSVSLSEDGNTLAVGAADEDSLKGGIKQELANQPGPEGNESKQEAGAVYLFEYDADTNWQQTAYIKAHEPTSFDSFGNTVQLSADGLTLAIGAAGNSSDSKVITHGIEDTSVFNNNALSTGAAYIFTRPSLTGAWRQQAFIKAPNADNFDNFGTTLSLSADGNRLAVGSPNETSLAIGLNGDQANSLITSVGAVYLYSRQDGLWQSPVYIKASFRSDLNAEQEDGGFIYSDGFASSLSLSGDGNTLAVGAKGDDISATGINPQINNDPAVPGSGAVYLY